MFVISFYIILLYDSGSSHLEVKVFTGTDDFF